MSKWPREGRRQLSSNAPLVLFWPREGPSFGRFREKKREKTPKISGAVTVLMTRRGKSGEVAAGCVWSAGSRKKIAGAKIGVWLQCRKWGEDGALVSQREGPAGVWEGENGGCLDSLFCFKRGVEDGREQRLEQLREQSQGALLCSLVFLAEGWGVT